MKRNDKAKKSNGSRTGRRPQMDYQVFSALNQYAKDSLIPAPGESCSATDLYFGLRSLLGLKRTDTSADLRDLWRVLQLLLYTHHAGFAIEIRTGLIFNYKLSVPVVIPPSPKLSPATPKAMEQAVSDDYDVDELLAFAYAED